MLLCVRRRRYLYEIGDSGQQVVEGDLGLFEVGLRGAEGHALPAPGAGGRAGDSGRGADPAHDPVPDLAAASHVRGGAPPQRHAPVGAFVLPGQGDRSGRGSWGKSNGREGVRVMKVEDGNIC